MNNNDNIWLQPKKPHESRPLTMTGIEYMLQQANERSKHPAYYPMGLDERIPMPDGRTMTLRELMKRQVG